MRRTSPEISTQGGSWLSEPTAHLTWLGLGLGSGSGLELGLGLRVGVGLGLVLTWVGFMVEPVTKDQAFSSGTGLNLA